MNPGDNDSNGGEQGILPYKSGVSGIVTRGPMCPVAREGDSCPDVPYATEIQIHPAGSDVVFAAGQSDKNGKFQFNIPPGEYTVVAANEGISKTCKGVSVIVGPDRIENIAISCDTGIR